MQVTDWNPGSHVTESIEEPESIESKDDTESIEDYSDNSGVSVTSEQRMELSNAINLTIEGGVGGRNSGIFQFARKIIAILPRIPDFDLVDELGEQWHQAAVVLNPDLDQGVVTAELDNALAKVKRPDDGNTLLTDAMRNCLGRDKPHFVRNYPDESPSVMLAKLILELHHMNDGGVFYLSCRNAGDFAGISHVQANRILNLWVKRKFILLVKKGTPGPAGSPAHRFKYIESNDQ